MTARAAYGAFVLSAVAIVPDRPPVSLPGADHTGAGYGYLCDIPPIDDVRLTAILRRAGRSQVLALTAASRALNMYDRPLGDPSRVAVTFGTGLGSIGETVDFLENMIRLDEQQPRPARFVNSVHNSAAASVALACGLTGENRTFIHESISFELALKQALYALNHNRADFALACGVDEMSPYLVSVGAARRWWKESPEPLSPPACDKRTPGTLPGEGAVAILLGRNAAPGSASRVAAVCAEPLASPGIRRIDAAAEARAFIELAASSGVAAADIDLVLAGANGDAVVDALYDRVHVEVESILGRSVPFAAYKDRCGEFCTAAAVGAAMAMEHVASGRCRAVMSIGFPQARYRSAVLVTT